MEIKSTKDYHQQGISFLIYAQSGAGKTFLCSTLPKPLILSAESGLLSLVQFDLPYIQINTIDDLYKAYEWLTTSPEADQFESVALDSISEIAEVILADEKKRMVNGKLVDPRQAYGALIDQMGDLIRAFRDLPKNVYFSAKLEKQTDEMGRILHSPSMPGNKTAQSLPYFFDEVFALRMEKGEDGKPARALMTVGEGLWLAKDRSGALNMYEDPDLGAIIRKIKGEVEPEETLSDVMSESEVKQKGNKK